jgi:putative two-component system response regulator
MPEAKATVLVVDDIASNRELLEALLVELGHDVRTAEDGVAAMQSVEAAPPDLILLDIDMPRLDGLEVCRRLKAHPRHRLIPIVIITAHADRAWRLAGIDAGADDLLTKPFDSAELRVRTRVLLRHHALNKRLDASESVVRSLARTIEARDVHTVRHGERVGLIAREIARATGASDECLADLVEGGLLHDIGKIGIPDHILLKTGPLTPEEWTFVYAHPAAGERIVLPLRSVNATLPIIRHHHERWDGRGYPDRLVGTAIPFAARVVAVGDAWDAMTNARAYRPRLEEAEALERLRCGAGTQWDAALVEVFVQLVESRHLTPHVKAA